jgi:PAS domain S-box-containing protein
MATSLGPVQQWPAGLRTITQLLLASRHPMFVCWGPEFIQIYNDGFREAMGRETHPGVLGGSAPETWGDAWGVIGPEIAQVLAGGPATWHEDRLIPVTRRGIRGHMWWTYSVSPIEEESAPNGVGGVLVICEDVTAAHLATRTAEENEARYRRLFESIEEGYFVADVIFDDTGRPVDFAYLEANSAATRIVGTDFTGRRLREVDPEYEEYWYETFGRVALTGESAQAILYAKPDDIWYDFHVTKMEPENPDSRRIAILFFDAGASVRAEQALRESEEKYRSVFTAIDEGFCIVELQADETGRAVDYRLIEVNAAFERQTGLADVIGRMGSEVAPGSQQSWISAYDEVARSGEAKRFENFHEPTNRWYDVYVSRVAGHAQPRVCIVFNDVTDRHRATEDLRESQMRLSLLVAELQHRTRNLLSVVSGIADQIRATSSSLEEFGEAFDRRLVAIGRVQGLLSMGRLPSIALDQLIVMELEAHGVDPYAPSISLIGPTVALPAHAVQLLALALHELTTNALKHGALKPQQRLEIGWETTQTEEGKAPPDARVAGTWRAHRQRRAPSGLRSAVDRGGPAI